MSHLIQNHFQEPFDSIEDKYVDGPEVKENSNNLAKLLIAATIAAGAYVGCKSFQANEEKPFIIGEGFPKGYHIENVNIPTRGEIIRVEKLPGENYQKTVDPKTGMITFKGNFEYEIKPFRGAMPKDDDHSDIYGRTPDNNPYWTDIRNGEVKLHKGDGPLEQKVNK